MMFTKPKRALAVAAGVSAVAALVVPAAMATELFDSGTGARLDGEGVPGLSVNLDGSDHSIKTSLIGLQLTDGAKLLTYCVELEVSVDSRYPDMVEVDWDDYPQPGSAFHENREKVNWILHNSHPAVDAASIAAATGLEFNGGLSVEEAITATQAAIWHFTDSAELSGDATTEGDDSDADVVALYDYLTGEANVGLGEQPDPALTLTPKELAGESGEVIGPFTVATTAELVELTASLPEGVTLVDADGAEVGTELTDGAELYVDVPAETEDGEGSFEMAADVTLSLGRLFVGANYDENPTQSLILAQAENSRLQVEGNVTWVAPVETPTPTPTPTETPSETPTPTPTPTETPSESPTPTPTATETPSESPTPTPTPTDDDVDLPDTGSSPVLFIIIGVVLVGGGVAALLIRRRAGANTPAE